MYNLLEHKRADLFNNGLATVLHLPEVRYVEDVNVEVYRYWCFLPDLSNIRVLPQGNILKIRRSIV